MSGKGHKVGSRCEVYFNLEGKRLDPYGRNGEKINLIGIVMKIKVIGNALI
jgi:hypothetical protein